MARFGRRSKQELATCHPDLCAVLEKAIEITDFSVYKGIRSLAEQQEVFDSGHSLARPGQSKHNPTPEEPLSRAADLWAYPINWEDLAQQSYVAGIIIATAVSMDIGLRWGNDWDRDGDTRDNRFDDLPHFELT